MKRIIKKVAVLGSGIMGSRIACLFANIGLDVLLLDIVPKELTREEREQGLDLFSGKVRNRIVTESLESAMKSSPSPLYKRSFARRISHGNFEDHMKEISSCDWIIEAVVENLEIKKNIFTDVEKYRREGTLVTTNTSGIPVHLMLENRSADFKQHFCGAHFFNPPRYLPLLEIIPTSHTSKETLEFLTNYGKIYLGKTTIVCKDTPAFIANRIGIYGILKVIDSMLKSGLNIDEVDKLTGTVVGRPKSATFRTMDVVGLDTIIKVASNLYDSLENDEARELFRLPDLILEMEKRKWLGDKSGQGFYRKTKDKKGRTEILTLDLKSMEYKSRKKVKFNSFGAAKGADNLADRFRILINAKDKAGSFYRDSFYGLFRYITNRIPEISDELYKIDDAVCAGFGWEKGPFETWDLLGMEAVLHNMEKEGYKPAEWIYEMVKAGIKQFYRIRDGVKYYYDIKTKGFLPVPDREAFIILDNLRPDKEIWKNAGASLIDLGNGILNVEFHSKMNTMGSEVMEGILKGIDLAEKNFRGLVIGNQGPHFTAGANLGILFMYAIEQEYDEIDLIVREFQNTIMRARYSAVPVVLAIHSLTLGGGCELTLHADTVQALAETYIGLVEVGIGLIPSGGGTKEMTRRVALSYDTGDIELNVLQNIFMNIATAKVSTSAHEAFDLKFLRPGDHITMNKNRLISDAKAAAIRISEEGYVMPNRHEKIRVLGKTGMALFLAGINGMLMGGYISEHDALIARKIAWVMCGGDLSYPQEVSEQYLLDMEREAFLSLLGERKTLERIEAIIQGKKPLRN